MNFMLIFTVVCEWSKVLVITTRYIAVVFPGWCWTEFSSCAWRIHGWKWIWLEATAIWEWGSCSDFKSCSIVFAFLQCLCCCCHMIPINRCKETTSNIFSTQSITWHTQMQCTPWIIITDPQLLLTLKVHWGQIRGITAIMAVARWLLCSPSSSVV